MVSFMEDPTPRHSANPNSMRCLEVTSEEGDSAPPSPRRSSMTETIRKSFQMFTTVKLDESDEECEGTEQEEGNDEGEEEDEKGPFRFFFCCS
jgi:hypothetical protein